MTVPTMMPKRPLSSFLDAVKQQSEPEENRTSSDDQWIQGVCTSAPSGGRINVSFDGNKTSVSCKYVPSLYTPSNGVAVWCLKVGNNAPIVVFSTAAASPTLVSSDITNALGYTPLNKAGDTETARLTLAADLYMTAGSASGRVLYQDTSYLYMGAIDQARDVALRAQGADVVTLRTTGIEVAGTISGSGGGAPTLLQPSLSALSLSAGWSNWGNTTYRGAFYSKDAEGFVQVIGLITPAAAQAAGAGFATLPVGYRPAADLIFACVTNGAFLEIQVHSNGGMSINNAVAAGAYVSLSNIRFPTN